MLGTHVSARKSEQTRARILDGAMQLLWSAPYRELTVSTLMAHVGVSRPAFYQYFQDLHGLMEELLRIMREDLLEATRPWFAGEGDPVTAMRQSLRAMTGVSYEWGPFIRAVSDAATADGWLERTWFAFLNEFDVAVAERIGQLQLLRDSPSLDPMTVAVSLNRLNVSMIVFAFGRRPRRDPGPVCEALTRIWVATLHPETIEGGGTSWEGSEAGNRE